MLQALREHIVELTINGALRRLKLLHGQVENGPAANETQMCYSDDQIAAFIDCYELQPL